MTLAGLRALGAPDLPPGHFYRVRTDSFGFLQVEVRREGRVFSTCIAEALTDPTDDDTAEEALANACRIAVDKAEARFRAWRLYAAVKPWEGDHH